jgi:cytochrome c oxidase subunit 2
MRRLLRIVEEDEYNEWLSQQQSWYLQNIRNGDEDPYKGVLLDVELEERANELNTAFAVAMEAEAEEEKIVRLNYVNYQTGSAMLTDDSRYELDNVIRILSDNPELRIELSGHTDNTGNASDNLRLSQNRAESVRSYLVTNGVDESRLSARGYGQTNPIDTNDTPEGRAQNRRTEIKILG